MRSFTEQIISLGIFALLLIILIASPWLFGAWEMWYFWPFAVMIFTVGLLLGVRLLLSGDRQRSTRTGHPGRQALLWLPLPFLGYALIRSMTAPVFMDAERSMLLFLTPWLLAICILWGIKRSELRLTVALLGINFAALGIYGILNHCIAENAKVLWLDGFPQYQQGYLRATGSFFCPDHFAGALELGMCLALGFIMNRESPWSRRIPALILLAICIAGIILSKSRGAGLTVIVVGAAALVYGLRQWQWKTRWALRAGILLVSIITLFALWNSDISYMRRFRSYITIPQEGTRQERLEQLQARALRTCRGTMIAAAIRGWKTAPWFGIGPGMHKNTWFHFGPTPDGDREHGIWPSQPNNTLHSFEVHSDWVQLLQEYGVIGLVLFLIPLGGIFYLLVRTLNRAATATRNQLDRPISRTGYSLLLAGILAIVAMGFHSLGDFCLQIPALTWLLAAMTACALAQVRRAA